MANSFPDKINNIIINNAIIGSAVANFGCIPHGASYVPTMALFVCSSTFSSTKWVIAGFYAPNRRGYFYSNYGEVDFASGVSVDSRYIYCNNISSGTVYYYAVK